jgi:hypothetical protein
MAEALRRYCLCGATASAASTPPALAEGVIREWQRLHSGEGCGPATDGGNQKYDSRPAGAGGSSG